MTWSYVDPQQVAFYQGRVELAMNTIAINEARGLFNAAKQQQLGLLTWEGKLAAAQAGKSGYIDIDPFIAMFSGGRTYDQANALVQQSVRSSTPDYSAFQPGGDYNNLVGGASIRGATGEYMPGATGYTPGGPTTGITGGGISGRGAPGLGLAAAAAGLLWWLSRRR